MDTAPSSTEHAALRIPRPPSADEWRFGAIQPPDADRVKTFIRERFRSAYDARIRHFLPDLLALHRGEALMAACGLRRAGSERLFLETYLDAPIEDLLAHGSAPFADRAGIVEVGNLSIARPGASRQLIAHLTLYLHAMGVEWTVFTAVPALRNNFMRLGIPLYIVGNADPSRIAAEDRDAWGSYYDQRPVVCAVRVSEAQTALALAA